MSVLHPGPKLRRLVNGGLGTVGQVVDDAIADYPAARLIPAMGRRSLLVLQQRLAALSESVLDSGAVDWEGFGRRCGLSPGGEHGALPPLAAEDRDRPLSCLHLGARTARLEAAGLLGVGDVLDDLEAGFPHLARVRGAGAGARELVRQRLAALAGCMDAGGAVDWARFDRLWGGDPGPPAADVAATLPDGMLARAIEVLRPGTKAAYLHDAGIHTLGDLLADGVCRRLRGLPGIGPKTARQVPARLAELVESAMATGGEPDWDGVAASWGFPPVPAHPVHGSQAFLAALPEVIAAVLDAHPGGMERLILSERISLPPGERRTLEAIAAPFGVSRERVRQRESRLVDSLSDALIGDDQSAMPLHFRESFRAYWVAAAEHYAGVAELGYPEFVKGLQAVWGISAADLAPFMPLAVAILADGVRVPRPGPVLHPALSSMIPEAVLARPLGDFPVRRAREGLAAAGLVTFGHLLEAAREDRLPPGRNARIALEIINGVGAALAAGPPENLETWAGGLGLVALPATDPADGRAFLGSLDEALGEGAGLNATSGRAQRIYRMRTCIPRRRRPTLADTAESLGSHGPTIKREESVMLASLHAQIVERDMTDAAVLWRPGFLSFFAESSDAHGQCGGDYAGFCGALAARWGLDASDVHERAEGLWAVLALYPGGRRARAEGQRRAGGAAGGAVPKQTTSESGVVVLRGFRRAH